MEDRNREKREVEREVKEEIKGGKNKKKQGKKG